MSDILSLQTPYVDGDTVTSTNLNDLVKKATFTSAVVDGATTQLSSGAIIVRDGGITEQKLSTAAQAKLLQGPEIEAPTSSAEAFVGGTKAGDTRGTFALDIQNKQSSAATTKVASGDSAVALGFENTAAGDYCTAVGQNNTVDSDSQYSTAVGQLNTFDSDDTNPNLYSSIFGYANTVTDGKNCVAIGKSNSTSSQNNIVMGVSNSATQFGGVAIGDTNTVSGGYSIAVGKDNTSSGMQSVAFGDSNSASDTGIAFGVDNTASNSAVAMGLNCLSDSPTAVAIGKDVICDQINSFAVGNGISVLSGSDISTFEIGIGRSSNALRGHPNGQIAFTLENSATAPIDDSTTSGEANLTLPRSMFTIQRNGDAFTLYFNDGGTIKSLSLGSVS